MLLNLEIEIESLAFTNKPVKMIHSERRLHVHISKRVLYFPLQSIFFFESSGKIQGALLFYMIDWQIWHFSQISFVYTSLVMISNKNSIALLFVILTIIFLCFNFYIYSKTCSFCLRLTDINSQLLKISNVLLFQAVNTKDFSTVNLRARKKSK